MTDTPANVPTPEQAPWTAADFEPEKAWNLVQNLRAERDKVRETRDALKVENEALKADASASASQAASLQRELWTANALAKHPLPADLSDEDREDFLAYLSGSNAEEVERKAARLAALRGEKATEEPQAGDEDGGIAQRPTPAMKPVPGHGGEEPLARDHAAIAASIRSREI